MKVAETKPPLPPHEQLLVACPHCGAPQGKPIRVATVRRRRKEESADDESVDITMGCDGCEQTWMVQKLTHDEPPA